MREPPESKVLWAGMAVDEETIPIDPLTGVRQGRCRRCNRDGVLEGSHNNPSDGLCCCYCEWRLDKHLTGVPLGQNGRKHCDLCKWFEPDKSVAGAEVGRCLGQRLVPIDEPGARGIHPLILARGKCPLWRLGKAP